MAMDLLFENETQLDEAVIHYIIEKNLKGNRKSNIYRLITLFVGVLSAAAAIYFGWVFMTYRQSSLVIYTIALAVICIYSFYILYKSTAKNQAKSYQDSYSKELLIPRKIKVYKNVMYQSAGKNHGEYRLYQFSDIETWDHFFLLRYEKSYVVIDKNGFTLGTADEFEKFMKNRIVKNC